MTASSRTHRTPKTLIIVKTQGTPVVTNAHPFQASKETPTPQFMDDFWDSQSVNTDNSDRALPHLSDWKPIREQKRL